MQRVPWRRDLIAGERGAWVIAPLDGDPVAGVDHDPLGIDVERRASVGAVERRHDDVLTTRIEFECRLIAEDLGPPLAAPERAANREARGDRLDMRPAVEPSVSLQDTGQQIVHRESPSLLDSCEGCLAAAIM